MPVTETHPLFKYWGQLFINTVYNLVILKYHTYNCVAYMYIALVTGKYWSSVHYYYDFMPLEGINNTILFKTLICNQTNSCKPRKYKRKRKRIRCIFHVFRIFHVFQSIPPK